MKGQYTPVNSDDSVARSKLLGSNESDLPMEHTTSYSLPYSRTLTFSRALTFDTTHLKRNLTLTFGFDIESDEAWTKSLLDSYHRAANTGVEGDIPIPADFMRNREFWKTLIIAGINGTFIGLFALGFLNFADRVRIFIPNFILLSDSK